MIQLISFCDITDSRNDNNDAKYQIKPCMLFYSNSFPQQLKLMLLISSSHYSLNVHASTVFFIRHSKFGEANRHTNQINNS